MKLSFLILILFFSLQSLASNNLDYPFQEMVDYMVKHSPESRDWDGEKFVSTPLFTSPIDPPKVEFMTPAEMRDFAGNVPGIMALYDSDLVTMFLDKNTDPQSIEGYSIILHELVHHMQFKMGLTEATKCPQSLEYDAYRIQLLYLEKHKNDVDPQFFNSMQLSSMIMGAEAICYEDLNRP